MVLWGYLACFSDSEASTGDLTDLGGVSEQLSGLKVSDGLAWVSGVWDSWGSYVKASGTT